MKQISYEEIDAFLEGSLSAEREKEVEEAVNNSKELQDVIQVTIDIDDMMMFDKMKGLQLQQSTEESSSMKMNAENSSSDTKWGKYLSRVKVQSHQHHRNGSFAPRKSNYQKETAGWQDEEYRRAADSKGSKMIKLKSRKRVKRDDDSGHFYLGEVIVGIIVLIILVLIKTCR